MLRLLLLLSLPAIFCVAMYVSTGNLRWRRWAVGVFKWLVVAALCVGGLAIIERLLMRLL